MIKYDKLWHENGYMTWHYNLSLILHISSLNEKDSKSPLEIDIIEHDSHMDRDIDTGNWIKLPLSLWIKMYAMYLRWYFQLGFFFKPILYWLLDMNHMI